VFGAEIYHGRSLTIHPSICICINRDRSPLRKEYRLEDTLLEDHRMVGERACGNE
jgi:hypothetical protein